jgi:pimeloyl-ACP methyl ester carboxylesterase
VIGRRALALGAIALAAPAARAQTRYRQGTMQRAVRFAGSGGAMLAGTLLLPLVSEIQYVPGVVLIAGSGPTDRDGNNPGLPVRTDVLKQIAELLARASIATLRYDKRGIGASTASPGTVAEQERFFAWENFVGDVRAAHAELMKHDEIKPWATALLGHSEGGLLALAAAPTISWRPPHGLVLAATPGWPYDEIIRRQIARSAPALLAATERLMTAVRSTGRVPPDVPRELQSLFPPYIGPFLQGAMAFDPAKSLAATEIACLLLQGGADNLIVPLGDIEPLLDALPRRSGAGEALVAPAVSHNLKTVTGPSDPGFSGPLAPAIADKLTSWLRFLLSA